MKAIYAFSGDPITYGHIDIIKRASKVFDELIVAIGVNPDKQYMFSLSKRQEMAQTCLKNITNVSVVSFKGLLVDFAYEKNVNVIIKGVRSIADLNYEQTLHQMGESQHLGIDTFILLAKPELAHVSSSAVKQMQLSQGLIHEYVPLNIKQVLEAKISGQYLVGVTGVIAAGKSYVCEKLQQLGQKRNIKIHHIDLDKITHQILQELPDPQYKVIREKIYNAFCHKCGEKKQVLLHDNKINRKVLGEIVFADQTQLQILNRIMYNPLLVRIRRELLDKKGLILFNGALLIESHMNYLCNNNFILVDCDKDTQTRRLNERNLNDKQIQTRIESQYTYEEKKNHLKEFIRQNNHGHVWEVKSNSSNLDLDSLLDNITDYFKI